LQFRPSCLYYKIYVIFGIYDILAINNADTTFAGWLAGHGARMWGGEVHTGF